MMTRFEEFSMDDIPYFVELATYLAERGVAVPSPYKDKNGIALKQLKGRPAMLQKRFNGHHVSHQQLTTEHCAAIGTALAKLHSAGEDFYLTRYAHRGVFWWRRESQAILSHLSEQDGAILQEEVARFDELLDKVGKQLSRGVTHGDLFHDNVLFNGSEVDAIIDLYNAATAYHLYDLAIVANDWCTNPDGSIDAERETALLTAYGAERPFSELDHQHWPDLARAAAMRFWLSRLIPAFGIAQANRDSSDMVIKDPDELKRILLTRRNQPTSLPRG